MKSLEVDLLVLGSGFTASVAWHHASEQELTTAVIDISRLSQSIRVSDSLRPIIDPEVLEKTARRGGGSSVWGGGISIPNESGGWRIEPDSYWSQDFKNWLEKNANHFLNLWFGDTGKSRAGKSNPLGVSWAEEIHHVTSNRNSKLINEGFLSSIIDCQRLGSIDIGKKSVRLRFIDVKGEILQVVARQVALAAGAIVNAVLIAEMTGQGRFSLGNHLVLPLGTLERQDFRLGLRAQLSGVKNFSTYTFKELAVERAHAIRFVKSEGSVGSVKELIGLKLLRKIHEFWGLVLLRSRIPRSLTALCVVDYELGTLLIAIERESGFVTNIRLDGHVPDEEIRGFARTLQRKIKSTLGGAFNGNSVHRTTQFVDAAHYWGTHVRFNDDSINIIALGAGNFESGGHGHPTFLAMLDAQYNCERLISSKV